LRLGDDDLLKVISLALQCGLCPDLRNLSLAIDGYRNGYHSLAQALEASGCPGLESLTLDDGNLVITVLFAIQAGKCSLLKTLKLHITDANTAAAIAQLLLSGAMMGLKVLKLRFYSSNDEEERQDDDYEEEVECVRTLLQAFIPLDLPKLEDVNLEVSSFYEWDYDQKAESLDLVCDVIAAGSLPALRSLCVEGHSFNGDDDDNSDLNLYDELPRMNVFVEE